MIETIMREASFDELYEKLKNENKIFKIRNKKGTTTLTEDYLFFLKKLEETSDNFKEVEEGQVVKGTIASVNKKEIIIDINFKDNVFVETRTVDQSVVDGLHVGDPIDVLISEISESPYFIKGSITDLLRMNISNVVKEHFNDNNFFYGTVIESQPAGYYLDLEVDGQIVDAFMPNTLAGVNKLHDPSSLVNKKIEVMIETLEQDKGIYVVSRKKFLETLIPERIKQLRRDWMKDKAKVYDGHITGTTPFGAFVEFCDYLTGMIHRYNVHPEWQTDEKWATMKPGMSVNFYIKDIISKKNKVILTQILRESLWDKIKIDDDGRPYFQGVDTIVGKVVAIKPFGALIQLDDETNGLIPSTYLQKNKIDLKVGEQVEVNVTSIIKDERKINLSYVRTI
jgi:small subunit ribosomal protein S1